ncbi:MAG: DegT/DnrJ/EryC1/StrS family aminotransferase [Syntrophales bacterium]|nr:DegT/DnrJ/EryC1/StrS family aminotransferase [Syntrophales bacterium]
MMIQRTLPPTVAPIYCLDIANGFMGILRGRREVDRFEGELREYFGVRHCFTLSSGRAALTVILQALRALHPERRAVVIPAYTCYSVAASIVRAGLAVRLCDVDAQTLDFDYAQLESIVTGDAQASPKILAIIPTHLFGLPSDIDRVTRITSGHKIFLIEDAAQAFGGGYKKNKLGTIGDVGFFSLGRGKPITTVEGGIIITDRDDIACGIEDQIKGIKRSPLVAAPPLIFKALFLALFVHPWLYWFPKKLPFLRLGETLYNEEFAIGRLSPFQAGLARRWQRRIEYMKQARRKRALRFLPIGRSNRFHGYVSDESEMPDLLRFPLLFPNAGFREDQGYRAAMDRRGIVPQYPTSIKDIEGLQGRFTGQQYPGADQVAAHLVTLPIHPLVSQADADQIIELLKDSR